MAIIAEVLENRNRRLRAVGTFNFEAQPTKGDVLKFPNGREARVLGCQHVAGRAPRGEPTPMHCEVVVAEE